MPRVQRVTAAAALFAAGALAAGVALAAPGRRPPPRNAAEPTLRLLTTTPFALGGAGFAPRSVVRLTIRGAGPARTVAAETSARGTFRASFGWVAVDPCASGMIVVTARDPEGRRATVKQPCRTAHRRPGVRAAP